MKLISHALTLAAALSATTATASNVDFDGDFKNCQYVFNDKVFSMSRTDGIAIDTLPGGTWSRTYQCHFNKCYSVTPDVRDSGTFNTLFIDMLWVSPIDDRRLRIGRHLVFLTPFEKLEKISESKYEVEGICDWVAH